MYFKLVRTKSYQTFGHKALFYDWIDMFKRKMRLHRGAQECNRSCQYVDGSHATKPNLFPSHDIHHLSD